MIYSNEFKQQIIHEYKTTNISTLHLAKKNNIARLTLYRWLQQANIFIRKETQKCDKSLKQEIIDKYKTGQYTVYKLSKEYALNYSSINNWLIQENLLIVNSNKTKHYTNKEKNEILQDYINSTMSMKQLAKKYNINYSTISRWIHNSNIPVRHRHYTKQIINQVINLYKKLKNVSLIANQMNIATTTINTWLRKNNIKLIPKYTEEFKQKIINEYNNSDKSLNYFYTNYGIRHSCLTTWLKNAGVSIRKSRVRKNITNNIKNNIYQCYQQGFTKLQICKKFHISYKNIEDIINAKIN